MQGAVCSHVRGRITISFWKRQLPPARVKTLLQPAKRQLRRKLSDFTPSYKCELDHSVFGFVRTYYTQWTMTRILRMGELLILVCERC
jgi:hypothetical protein